MDHVYRNRQPINVGHAGGLYLAGYGLQALSEKGTRRKIRRFFGL